MNSWAEATDEYRRLIEEGTVQAAYRGLMDYIMGLRTYFEKNYPDYSVSGTIYPGYMDMTYFSFFPESLKNRKLKVGIVFIHEKFEFEVWLFGYNKSIQAKYWKLFKKANYKKYRIPSTIIGVDSILEGVLVENPNFRDLAALTDKIEKGTLNFIKDIEDFLSKGSE